MLTLTMSYHFYRSIPLPLLLLMFVSLSSTIRNLSQHESVFHSETHCIYSESYKKGKKGSPHCLFFLPCNTPRCVFYQKQRVDIAFIFFFLCCFKNQASISTCLRFCNKIQSNDVLFEVAAFL